MSVGPEPGDAALLNINGERVAIGPLRRELVPLYQCWLNDFRHARNFDDTPEPWTTERTLVLFEARAAGSPDTVIFTIFEREPLRPIGYTTLTGISFRHRSAEFAIHIGEDDAHGKGYGTETTRLMLDYAFSSLSLHFVFLMVAEYNLAGWRAYERAGFRERGRLRQAWLMADRFRDEIIMDCLSDEITNATLTMRASSDDPAT